MSRQMVQTFFPSLIHHAQQYSIGNRIYSSLFPLETAHLCHESIYRFQSTVIRLPYLGMSAIWGVIIGFIGCILLTFKVPKILMHDDNRTKQRNSRFNLCLAFFAFGGMNLCGLFIHCLWEAPETSYATSTPIGWALDCYFTGCSGCSLAFLGVDNNIMTSSTQLSLVFYLYAIVQIMGMMCLINFLLLGEDTIFLELWYLVPVTVAGCMLALNIVVGSIQVARSQRGTTLLSTGALLALGGIVFDATLCNTIGTSSLLLDLPTASTLMFLGCDFVFVGLLMIVVNNPTEKLRSPDVDDKCKLD